MTAADGARSDGAAAPRIVDAHCHVASEAHIPRSFVDGAVANMAAALAARGVRIDPARLAERYLEKLQDPLCDALVAELKRAGIGHGILLVPDFTWALKDCRLTIEESLLAHREILERHRGWFTVFGGVDPRWGSDGVALFERALTEFGFRGFKVYPPCGFSPSDPALFPFYELCAHHRAPVVVHSGPTSPVLGFSTTNPFEIDRAAHAFPTVNFILAHGSVHFVEECVMLCRFRPNVYLDISAYQSAAAAAVSADPVAAIVARGINHKVLFGTDWPVFRLQGDQREFVEALLDEHGPLSTVSVAERDLILHGNIERLLGTSSLCT